MKLNMIQRFPILLVVVCLVVHLIVPAFATYYGDIDDYPIYNGDYPFSGGGYIVCVDLEAEASGYPVWFWVRWFEDPTSLTAFYDDNNLTVRFTGTTSFRYYSFVKNDGSFAYSLQLWSEVLSGDTVRLFDVVCSDFPVYFANGMRAFPTVNSTPSTLGSVVLWHNEDRVCSFENIPFPVKVSLRKSNTKQEIRFLDPVTNYTYECLSLLDYEFYGVSVGHNTASPQHYFNTDFILETPEDLYLFWDEDILTDIGDVTLRDYSGSLVLGTFAGVFPMTVQVKDNGFELIDCFEDVPTWIYEYVGSGTFAGVSTIVNETVLQYGPGSTLVLPNPSDLFLITDEDLPDDGEDPGIDDSGGGSGEDPGGDDSGGGSGADPGGDDSGGGSGADPGGDDSGGGSGADPGGDDPDGGSANGSGDGLDVSGLNNSAGIVSGGNNGLGGVVGDMNGIQNVLPVMPDNLGELLGGYLSGAADSPAFSLMLWNDPEYSDLWNVLITPALSCLSVSLLLYFVFGKATHVR